MNRMRLAGLIFAASLLFAGCAMVRSDPWDWLQDPSRQAWREVVLHVFGRDVRFRVPDQDARSGEHVRRWPAAETGVKVQEVFVSPEAVANRNWVQALFRWDEYWGGFWKKGGYDFELSVSIRPHGAGIDNLLDLSVDERIQAQREYYETVYSEPDKPGTILGRDYFLAHYWVKPFETQYHTWVVENKPIVTGDHETYMLPVSNQFLLDFTFFIRSKRWDYKDDPEWNRSRWEIVRQIMDTVQVTPDPFSSSP